MMTWENLLRPTRFGLEERIINDENMQRSQFQRDYDRLIFSSPFRRLQNKTQVFPLPGSVFVHNRLTHSLEVACVGRSLGNMLSWKLKSERAVKDVPLLDEIGTIVSTACLCHDLGNPPFGHSGEKAISDYFRENENGFIGEGLSDAQRADLANFEGNANALRLITNQFQGRRKGGYALTYSTIAALIKYPWGSEERTKKGKYGYFDSEKVTFHKIVDHLRMYHNKEVCRVVRHPLVYLVEAADDISYLIMDIEDAHKLNILSYAETKDLLLSFFRAGDSGKMMGKIEEVFQTVTDENEQIAYLRAVVINLLTNQVINVFLQRYEQIMNGDLTNSLVDNLDTGLRSVLKYCRDLSFQRIYNHHSVKEIELSGYKVLGNLIKEFSSAVMNPNTHYYESLLAIVPQQYDIYNEDKYERLRAVVDFVSGMTDVYALDLYRKINGISMSNYV